MISLFVAKAPTEPLAALRQQAWRNMQTADFSDIPAGTDDQEPARRARLYDMDDLAYRQFVISLLLPLCQERIVFQSVPTWRVQLPGSQPTARAHTDAEYGHLPWETNVWVPVLNCWSHESTQLHVLGKSINCAGDEVVVFDGVKLEHGGNVNRTRLPRVSFDFRFGLMREYQAGGTSEHGQRFEIGDYWTAL